MADGPFALWSLTSDGGGPSDRPWLPKPLDLFDPVFRAMGMLGWSAGEVMVMDVWMVASWLGLGHDGAKHDPVIRGQRGLVLPKDAGDPQADPQAAADHVNSLSGDDRRAAYRQAADQT